VAADEPTLPPPDAWRPSPEARIAVEAKHHQVVLGPPTA